VEGETDALGVGGNAMRPSRGLILASAVVICLGLLFSQGSIVSRAEDPQLYTAHSIWYENPGKVWSTNYKKGVLLPAGSAIKNVTRSKKAIQFAAVDTDIAFKIVFVSKHHPGVSIGDIYLRFTTEQTFEELTSEFSESEIEAIKAGKYAEGMSKGAILVSQGYPPEISTPSTDLDAWRYWRHRFATFVLHFDEAGKVESIEGG
jgi:hypothetical protein